MILELLAAPLSHLEALGGFSRALGGILRRSWRLLEASWSEIRRARESDESSGRDQGEIKEDQAEPGEG